MLIRSALVPLVLSLAACAPTIATAPAAPIAASPPVATVAEASAAPGAAGSSALLAAVPANATLVARIDGKVLRAAPIYANAMAAIQAFPLVQNRLDDLTARCGVNLLEAIDEVVIARTGPGENQDLTLARVRADDTSMLTCVRGLLQGKPTKVGGEAAVRLDSEGEGSVAVVVEGVTLIGSDANVASAIKALRAHESRPSKSLPTIDLGPSTVVSAALAGPGYGPVSSGTTVIEMDASHLALHTVVGVGSPAQAASLVEMVNERRASLSKEFGAAPDGVGDSVNGYLSILHITAEGAQIHADMEIKGGAQTQAAFIGTLSAMGVYGVRQYLAQAKLGEAKNTVGAIARGLVAYMEREDGTGKPATRFPPSAPPTPAKVPVGTKYVPDGSTWSHPTWKALRFEMSSPSYYSYEVITSKDGHSATVRAHGDLDGDGKISTIETTLTLGKDGRVVIPPKLVLKDELE